MAPVRVTNLDHIVLRTPDPQRLVDFYCGRLGLGPERLAEWQRGEAPFPSARIDATSIIDFFPGERPDAGTAGNLDHLCLVVAPVDLDALAAGGEFDVVEGPVRRWGARGLATSVYVRDPDGNVVELRTYPVPGDDPDQRSS